MRQRARRLGTFIPGSWRILRKVYPCLPRYPAHLRLLIGFTGVFREILHTRAPFEETMENYISL